MDIITINSPDDRVADELFGELIASDGVRGTAEVVLTLLETVNEMGWSTGTVAARANAVQVCIENPDGKHCHLCIRRE